MFIDAWYLEVLGKLILDDFDENMLELLDMSKNNL